MVLRSLYLNVPLVKDIAIGYDRQLFLKVDIYRGFLILGLGIDLLLN